MSNPSGLQSLPPMAPIRLSNGDELISRGYGDEIAILREARLEKIPRRKFDETRPWVLEGVRGVADVMRWSSGG